MIINRINCVPIVKFTGPSHNDDRDWLNLDVKAEYKRNFPFSSPNQLSLSELRGASSDSLILTKPSPASIRLSDTRMDPIFIELKQSPNNENIAEQQKLKTKATIIKLVINTVANGLQVSLLVHPMTHPVALFVVKPIAWLLNMATDVIFRPSNYQATKNVFASIWSSSINAIKSLFKSEKVSFAGNGSGSSNQQQNIQKSTLTQLLQNFMSLVEESLTKLDQAQAQRNPQGALDVEKGLLKSAKTMVDELGTEEEKLKAQKADLVYAHYEKYIDALDLTNPRPFSQVAEPVKEHLKIALFHALTSKDPDLTSWGKSYALKVGMTEQAIDQIIRS